jgi:hypothetical protein
MAAIPSNRCPNCSPISEPEQMRSAPADASSAIPITRALGDRVSPWGSEQSVCDPTLARMGAAHGCSPWNKARKLVCSAFSCLRSSLMIADRSGRYFGAAVVSRRLHEAPLSSF